MMPGDLLDRSMPLWWLSFADPDSPPGQRNMGVCVIPAYNMLEAIQKAWLYECNPGGDVAAFRAFGVPDEFPLAKLLSAAEATEIINRHQADNQELHL